MQGVISELLYFRSQLKAWHWQVKANDPLHRYLGEFEERVDAISDPLVEELLGVWRRPDFSTSRMDSDVRLRDLDVEALGEFLARYRRFVESLYIILEKRKLFGPLNRAAELHSAMLKFCYKLTLMS